MTAPAKMIWQVQVISQDVTPGVLNPWRSLGKPCRTMEAAIRKGKSNRHLPQQIVNQETGEIHYLIGGTWVRDTTS